MAAGPRLQLIQILRLKKAIMHRLWSLLVLLSFLPLSMQPSFAQDPSLHGIDVTDLDRKADPCNDFFEFSNGTWRANNPIPPSMTHWSKRWAAGEASKEQLKD